MDDSYAAGLIDGEGYVGIVEAGGSMQVRLKVSMTDKGLPALRALKETYGGQLDAERPQSESNRETHTWRLNGKRAADLLDRLAPMLLVKSEAVRIALAFQWMVDSAPRWRPGQAKWDEAMRRKAEVFREMVQEANHRGPDPWAPRGRPMLAVRRAGSWWEPDGDLFGPVEFSGRLPTSGMMVASRIYDMT